MNIRSSRMARAIQGEPISKNKIKHLHALSCTKKHYIQHCSSGGLYLIFVETLSFTLIQPSQLPGPFCVGANPLFGAPYCSTFLSLEPVDCHELWTAIQDEIHQGSWGDEMEHNGWDRDGLASILIGKDRVGIKQVLFKVTVMSNQ